MSNSSLSPNFKSVDTDDLLASAFEERVANINASIDKAKKAEKISKQENDVHGIAKAQSKLAFFNMIIGNHEQARIYVKSARPVLELNDNHTELGLIQYTIGSTYYKTDDYHLGLKHLTDSYLMYQLANDTQGQSRALKAIGIVYEFFREYEHAQDTYLKCVELSEQCGDKNGISNAYINLSSIYLRNDDLNQALTLIEESIRLKKYTNDKRGLAFALYGKAKVIAYLEKFEEAEKLFLESSTAFGDSNESVGIMMCHNKLGKMYLAQGEIDLAKENLNTVLEKGKKINHYLIMHKACYTLYLLEKSLGNQSEALFHLEQHLFYKDKVINKKTKNIIQSIKSISQMEMLEEEAKWQREKKEEVELKNAELDTFVYKVSHDLKGPISSLLGLFEIVKMDVKDEESLKYFNLYHTQINRLHSILMDFINLTQIKEKQIEPVHIHFEELVSECIDAHKFYDNFEDIKFDVRIKDISFDSDKSTINTILQNLIENAIKYARNDTDPYVKITISQDEKELCIEVEDNGVGISEEYQSRIFEMFFRANDKVQGSGLGLYILKNAVNKLAGQVKFDSTIHQGTTFQVLIPC